MPRIIESADSGCANLPNALPRWADPGSSRRMEISLGHAARPGCGDWSNNRTFLGDIML
ncbi:MAG: hypothetical protein R3D83_07920 [Caenibius sp.]